MVRRHTTTFPVSDHDPTGRFVTLRGHWPILTNDTYILHKKSVHILTQKRSATYYSTARWIRWHYLTLHYIALQCIAFNVTMFPYIQLHCIALTTVHTYVYSVHSFSCAKNRKRIRTSTKWKQGGLTQLSLHVYMSKKNMYFHFNETFGKIKLHPRSSFFRKNVENCGISLKKTWETFFFSPKSGLEPQNPIPNPPAPQGPSAPPTVVPPPLDALGPWRLGGTTTTPPPFRLLGMRRIHRDPFFETPKLLKKKPQISFWKQKKRGCWSLLNMNRFRK